MQNSLGILWYFYYACQVFLASFLIQPFILLLIYSVSRALGNRPRSTPFGSVTRDYQFGIIITAHRETEFIPPIIDSLLKQTHARFNAYVIADDCDVDRLIFLDPRIHILKPPSPLNDQMASLDYGFRHLGDEDEVIVIFDPDNLAHPDYLKVLNAWYNNGYNTVHGRMVSKNQEGTYAQLDNLGASLSNFMDKDMRALLGLSSNISGCGVSVDKALYTKIRFDEKGRTGGFDKDLQIGIVKNLGRIAYAPEALFYDEKVSDGQNFERQRIRWIATYFKFLGKGFDLLLTGLRRRNFNLIYFACNLLRPPYFILLILSCLITVADWFIDPRLSVAWLLGLAAFTLSFLLIVARDVKDRSVVKAVMYIPLIFYRQLRALFQLRITKKSLLKTAHSRVLYIDEIIAESSGRPHAPASISQNRPAEYASVPHGQDEDRRQDYVHWRS